MGKLNKVFRESWQILLRLVFPVRCPFCDRIVPGFTELVCDDCKKELQPVRHYCMKCGKEVAEGKEYCAHCREHAHYYTRGRCFLHYDDKVRHSIYRFKYAKRKEYAAGYASLMTEEMQEFIYGCQPDAFVPVPLHFIRRQKRGYNQAELLARALGRAFSIPVCSHLIRRTKNTIPQKKLSTAQRQNNLKRAFKFTRNDVKLNTIMIIDDIYTTGSTIDAIAQLCMEHGIQKIYFLTIAGGK